MIGDSRNDILAGQNANMDTIGLSYGYNYGQDIRELNPTEAFDGFADLVTWIMIDNS
jgi:phosphoglycolate phosphatase